MLYATIQVQMAVTFFFSVVKENKGLRKKNYFISKKKLSKNINLCHNTSSSGCYIFSVVKESKSL